MSAGADRSPTAAVASLQMYWTPTLSGAVEAWWRGLSAHLGAQGVGGIPATLSQPEDIYSIWRAPGLVFSQTCGGPLVTQLGDSVRVIGTPAYDTPYSAGIRYRSAIVVRPDDEARDLADLRGRRAAINGRESYSGCHALKGAIWALTGGSAGPDGHFFSAVVESGGHLESLRMVADNEADCAAIDGVTLSLAARDDPARVAGIRTLAATAAVPGLPYITRATVSDDELEAMRQAVEAAFADLALAETRSRLLLAGFERTDRGDYAPVAETIAQGREILL